jgi:hypothetical protein
MDTVKESKLKPHNIFNDSESTHLNSCIETEVLFRPTSIKANAENTVVNNIDIHVISWAPLIPTFLPKKPETIDPNKGNIIIVKYII